MAGQPHSPGTSGAIGPPSTVSKVRCFARLSWTHGCSVRSRLANFPAPKPHRGLGLPKWSRSCPADCPAGLSDGTPPIRRIRCCTGLGKSRACPHFPENCAHAQPETPLSCDNTGSVGGLGSHTPSRRRGSGTLPAVPSRSSCTSSLPTTLPRAGGVHASDVSDSASKHRPGQWVPQTHPQ